MSVRAIGKAAGYIIAAVAENNRAISTQDTYPFEFTGSKVINPEFAYGYGTEFDGLHLIKS